MPEGTAAAPGAPSRGRARLLIVDDDDELRSMLVRMLRAEGYDVEAAPDAQSALTEFGRREPDLIVLDIMLGAEDGLDVLSSMRAKADVPVILLTGRGHEADRVLGLKLGADDYVVKPFSAAELAARIATVLRRSRPGRVNAVLDFGDLTVDTSSRQVTVGGDPVDLTVKEFDLLAYLAASPRQVFSRDRLLKDVWESSSEWQDSSTVTEHVRRIRRKVEADPDRPRWILTVRGVGYRFEP